MNTREAARWYIERYRFWTVPVPWKTKGPVVKGWPDLRLTGDSDLNPYFSGEHQNIAILMGEPDNLSDVDIDSEEAAWAWKEYAIPTGLKWGRQSNPASHWLYYADQAPATVKYLDPVQEKDAPGEACMVELRCLTKEGKVGNPVVAPPSRHPENEDYEFVGGAGYPARIAREVIERQVRFTAAASLVGRYARDGACHQIFIALAGAMARAKWDLADAQRFLRAVYRVKWKEAAQLGQADKDADST